MGFMSNTEHVAENDAKKRRLLRRLTDQVRYGDKLF